MKAVSVVHHMFHFWVQGIESFESTVSEACQSVTPVLERTA